MPSSRLRTGALAGMAVLLALGAIAPAATGEIRAIQVTVEVRFLTVDTTFLEFRGLADARKPCRDDREVSLFYKPTETSPPQEVGEGETNGKGRFTIELASPAVAGFYSAVVGKEVEKLTRGDDVLKYICRPGTFPYTRF